MSDIDPLAVPARVGFAGDWHGNTRFAVWAIDWLAGRVDVLIHVGDFGLDFTREYLHTLDEVATFPILFIDGNHDDHDWLAKQPIGDNGLRRLSGKVWHIPRGFTWEWNGVRFLGCGGAFSVDRHHRQLGVSWWAGETITTVDIAACAAAGKVDVLVSHDTPAGYGIPGIDNNHTWISGHALAQAAEHRLRLRQIVDVAQPSVIVHGHYHVAYTKTAYMSYGPVSVIGLDRDGESPVFNTHIVDLAQLGPIRAVEA
jgi:predicted phosphodiesterase